MFAIDGDVTPVTQAITFAVVGGLFTLVTLLITNKAKRDTERRVHEEKVGDREALIAKETRDYARQDEVARRVDVTAKATMEKLRRVEDLGIVTHALVNSDKTATMRDQRDTMIVNLALMREVVSLKEDAGKQPSPETVKAIDALAERVVTMQAKIDDRLRQQEAAETANAERAETNRLAREN